MASEQKPLEIFSPELDNLLRWIGDSNFQSNIADDLFRHLMNIYQNFQSIEPDKSGWDLVWKLWIPSQRGRLQDFGDYEEYHEIGEVQSREEFEQLWLLEYPQTTQWHQFALAAYQHELFFALDRLQFQINLKKKTISGLKVHEEDALKLVKWIDQESQQIIEAFLENPDHYYKKLERDLPVIHRLGKIHRKTFWELFPEFPRMDRELGEALLDELAHYVMTVTEEDRWSEITLNQFLEVCKLGYLANQYPECMDRSGNPLSAREMYHNMADGRHMGLLDLPEDDPKAFELWYTQRTWSGGHPWEICRGGNSTHISISPYKDEKGWFFYVTGFSEVRGVETIRIAVALWEKNVPIILSGKEAMLRMVTGEDDIGIVPQDVTPRYCHELFPEEDKIETFMRLPYEEDDIEKMLPHIIWYPLSKLKKV